MHCASIGGVKTEKKVAKCDDLGVFKIQSRPIIGCKGILRTRTVI